MFLIKIEVKNTTVNANYFYRVGRKSARLVRAAAMKLALELNSMIDRPSYAIVTRVLQG